MPRTEELLIDTGNRIHVTRFYYGSAFSFPSENGGSKVVTLSSTSTLKLSFALDKPEEAGFSALILSTIDPRALPSQLGQVTNSNEAGLWRLANRQVSSASIPLVAKKGGRYRWEWDLATPSSTSYKEDILTIARLSEGRLKAQLLVAAAQKGDADKTLLVDLGTVAILDETYYQVNPNKKWLREWEMERYWSRPEISWTFREATKPVSSFKALIGLVTVLSPWLVLVSLVGLYNHAVIVRSEYPHSRFHENDHQLIMDSSCFLIGRLRLPYPYNQTFLHQSTLYLLAGSTGSCHCIILVWLHYRMDLHAHRGCTGAGGYFIRKICTWL